MLAFCTYCDRHFVLPALALARSLERHQGENELWVLALDAETAGALRHHGGRRMRVVELATLETAVPELAQARSNRSWAEYCFTLSPVWPAWLLKQLPEEAILVYLDADVYLFGSIAPLLEPLAAGASVVVTPHRFPPWLAPHYEQHGRYNVGVEAFRNDAAGRAVLADWRGRCLEWCYDRIEPDRYADQKYLDAWPARFGPAVHVLDHPGVNAAPWNWARHRWDLSSGGIAIDGRPLTVFHFARFRPLVGTWWWQSGQLDYGVMPRRLRQAIYGPYVRELLALRSATGVDFVRRSRRGGRAFFRGLTLRVLFGSDWLRVGTCLISGRAGLSRYSGRCLGWLRSRARS